MIWEILKVGPDDTARCLVPCDVDLAIGKILRFVLDVDHEFFFALLLLALMCVRVHVLLPVVWLLLSW